MDSLTAVILRAMPKASFIGDYVPEERELVFATDTNELGSRTLSGDIHWEKWDKVEPTQNHFIGSVLPLRSFGSDGDRFYNSINGMEYKKEIGEWVYINWGETQEFIEGKYELASNRPFGYSRYLGKYSYEFEDGYLPSQLEHVSNRQYLVESIANLGSFIKQDGSTQFDEGYYPSDAKDPITVEYMLSGDLKYIPPTTNPGLYGALWNKNGEVLLSEPEDSHFRIWTQNTNNLRIWFSHEWIVNDLLTYPAGYNWFSPTNGYVDLIGSTGGRFDLHDSGTGNSPVKIEVMKWGKISSFVNSFSYCSILTEFRVLDTEPCLATNCSHMFLGSINLQTIDLFEFPHCSDFSFGFRGTKINPVPDFDFSGVSNLESAFEYTTAIYWFNNSHGFLPGANLKNLFRYSHIRVMGAVDFSGITTMNATFFSTPNLGHSYAYGFQDVLGFYSTWLNSSLQWHFEFDDASSCYGFYNTWENTKLSSFPYVENFGSKVPYWATPTSHADVPYGFATFRGCTQLQTFPDIDLSHFSSLPQFFSGCTKLYNVMISENHLDFQMDTDNMQPTQYYPYDLDMGEFFRGCTSLVNAPQTKMKGLQRSRSIDNLFYGCTALTGIDNFIERWDKFTNLTNLLYGCSLFETLPINFTTSGAAHLAGAFRDTIISDFSKIVINESLRSLNGTFYNTPVKFIDLDMSQITDLTNTFAECVDLEFIGDIRPINSCTFYNTFHNSGVKCIKSIDTSKASFISADTFTGTSRLVRPNAIEIDLIMYQEDWVNPIDCSEIIT